MRPIAVAAALCLAASISCTADRETTGPSTRASSANPVVAETVACGATIVADFRLDNDLSCPGDALTVGADDIKINLNGHTISGAGAGVGITIRLRHGVSVKGGTISGFVTGIFIAQSNDIDIKDGRFTNNREAIFLNGTSGSVVKSNVVWQNQLRGIMLRPTATGIVSTDNVVMGNELADNPSGILVFGQSGNTFKGNSITRSTVGAFDLTGGGATGNVIKENVLTHSAAGIRFGAGWVGNEIFGNTIGSNTCGLLGPSAGNTIRDNLFTANTTDVCP